MPTNRSNVTLTNYVGGEVSPFLYGRSDLPLMAKSLAICRNWIVRAQGGSSFRPGFYARHHTRGMSQCRLIPFQFNVSDAYIIAATDKVFRFYRNNGVVLNTNKTITSISKASQAVLTSTSHGYANGTEVYVSGVTDMPEINNRFFIVSDTATNTFKLKDMFGNYINSSAYGSAGSGGTVASIFELTTPYWEADIEFLSTAQVADLMYIDRHYMEPRKLTRTSSTSWTIDTYTRTSDPFEITGTKSITGVTKANPGVITSTAHGFVDGDIISIWGVAGMTELNGEQYTVVKINDNTFSLKDRNGVAINTTSFTTYSSGGTMGKSETFPGICSATDDMRMGHFNSKKIPEGVWESRIPDGTTNRFDDFTLGDNAEDAVTFPLAPVNGSPDVIQAVANGDRQFLVLAGNSIRRLYGASQDQPLKPGAINAKPTDAKCAAIDPVVIGSQMYYIELGSDSVRRFGYSFTEDTFTSEAQSLTAEHLAQQYKFKRMVRSKGQVDIIWFIREDGKLVGLSYEFGENVAGWHVHHLGGDGVVESIASITKDDGKGQLWAVIKRTIDGQTVRSIETLEKWVNYPGEYDFYTGDKTLDAKRYANALFEASKNECYLDSAMTFNGSDLGRAANVTVTPSATSGDTVTITASGAIFTTGMIGREIWKKFSPDGKGGGRGLITGYTNSTHVTVQVYEDFDNTDTIAAGDWFLTAGTIYGLDRLEGETVGVVVDGAEHPDAVVENGKITLEADASVVTVGFKYEGIFGTLNIDTGGRVGPANSKPRNINTVSALLKDTLGIEIGPTLYDFQTIGYRDAQDLMGRVPNLINDNIEIGQMPMWRQNSSQVFVRQKVPAPATVLALDIEVYTTDEN